MCFKNSVSKLKKNRLINIQINLSYSQKSSVLLISRFECLLRLIRHKVQQPMKMDASILTSGLNFKP